MKKLLQYYQIFCNLSLDVVLGVLCCMLPLPCVLQVNMPLSWYLVLPACTWIIYLADHVIDVTRLHEEYPSPRHRFVKKHLRAVMGLILLISAAIAWEVLHHFSRELFFSGLVLLVVVLLHFVLVRINPGRRSWLNNKELAIAFVYATGIYIGPLSELYVRNDLHPFLILLYSCFLCVVFINLLMVSVIEHAWDEQMQNASFVRAIGSRQAIGVLKTLCLLGAAACAGGALFAPVTASRLLFAVYFLMIAWHYWVYQVRAALSPYLLYRKIAEALFWLPALLLLLLDC